ncbi:hypothetical protein [Chitinophaga barathri]|uniref:Uncharacterized protein n=1 Tax=Chitinophaga barathri TaxID=1647451 RepID=A0A3N4MM20_9BACT|nr:hypothetical protein [Chitinophaga barathri]RPD43116.1 hypothetical protein EG028_02140 [Chitinophaga barathri]
MTSSKFTNQPPPVTWVTGKDIIAVAEEAIEHHMDCVITKAFGPIRSKPVIEWLTNGVQVSYATVVELYALCLRDLQHEIKSVRYESLDVALKDQLHVPACGDIEDGMQQLLERRQAITYNLHLYRQGSDKRGFLVESLFNQLNEYFGRKFGITGTIKEKRRRCFIVTSLQGSSKAPIPTATKQGENQLTFIKFCAALYRRTQMYVSVEVDREVPDLFPSRWIKFLELEPLNEVLVTRGLQISIGERNYSTIYLTKKTNNITKESGA